MIYIGRSRNMSFNDLRDHPTDAAQKVADKAKGVVETARGAASSIADKVRSVEVGGTVRKAADQIREHANDTANRYPNTPKRWSDRLRSTCEKNRWVSRWWG
jgi:hypothetical protein